MSLKLQDCIDVARGILNDRDADGYRYSDHDLLEYGNGALRALVNLAPRYLYTDGDLTCIAGSARQHVFFDDAHSLVEVRRNKNGRVILQADRASMDAFHPNWQNDEPAPAVHWFPVPNDPMRFDLYPPAPEGQVVEVMYVRIPGPFAAHEETGLPETLKDAVGDYIVSMAEARDDEHVLSQRSTQFMTQFAARLKG